ncbi:MAG: nitronate monooxygenase [Calditrichaeota bacterium]|jgi:nitronate monooxygenase|nr:nitronate monooxygenase [Calditrichota bacterium]MBT7616127.1 nitronate monooxygenase [Calditrichota bacterium]MBT7789079.1 nitronate monooxygenase [Calditrichota bacterium]
MNVPQLNIGNLSAKLPIIQGGMGVRVSLAPLAAAVANEGGIGTISSIGLADVKLSGANFLRNSLEALRKEIRLAQSITQGHLAVNVMGVTCNAYDLVRTAVEEGIEMIAFGAGLPLKLPALVEDPDVNLVPIISSPRAASLILRTWHKKYNRSVSAFILEGPLAGGHLGFSTEQLQHPEQFTHEILLPELLLAVKPFEDIYGKKIPVIAAGGIFSGFDIARMLQLGASGVQMGTRFVCTEECSVSSEFKQAYLDAKEEDIIIVKSPVGMPGRAIRNRFIRSVENREKGRIKCAFRCLSACKIENARYCIAEALLNSYSGDVDRGLIFCGQNASRIKHIVTVKRLMDELVIELEQNLTSKTQHQEMTQAYQQVSL